MSLRRVGLRRDEVRDTYDRHLEVSKLLPEIFDSVQTDGRHCEEANPLDAVEGGEKTQLALTIH